MLWHRHVTIFQFYVNIESFKASNEFHYNKIASVPSFAMHITKTNKIRTRYEEFSAVRFYAFNQLINIVTSEEPYSFHSYRSRHWSKLVKIINKILLNSH